jgi:phosphatidate cytidylyltransferase
MAPSRVSPLTLRFLSALILGPAVLLAVWFGRPWFDLLMIAAAGLLAREWADLVGAGRRRLLLILLAICLVLLPLLGLGIGWCLATAAGAALAVAVLWRASRRAGWLAAGLLVAAVPCLAATWLREAAAEGRAILLWSFLVVWATDSGAYAFGRLIGGAKLAPRISPNKTWAGFFGGLVSAMAAGTAVGALAVAAGGLPHGLDLGLLALASAGASLVGQAGDLAESAVKRRFGAKDSGHLIPGHGGLLDRADSLLAVMPAVALVVGLARPDVMLWA